MSVNRILGADVFFRHCLRLAILAAILGSGALISNCGAGPGSVVDLAGPWEYRKGPLVGSDGQQPSGPYTKIKIPAQLDTLPELKGFKGWITLRRALPPEVQALAEKGVPISIRTGQLSDVAIIYVNDRAIGRIGSANPYETGAYRSFIGDVPAAAFKAGDNFIHYALYTDGSYPLHIYGPEMRMGASTAVLKEYYRGEITSLILLAIYFIIGLYHLLLYLRRRVDVYNLYFGLFAVIVSMYWVFTTGTREVLFGSAVLARIRAEHILLFGITGPFLLFLSTFFYGRHSRIALAVTAFNIILILITAVAQYALITTLLSVWQVVAMIGLLPYSIFYIARAMYLKRPDAKWLIVGLVILMLSAANDILVIQQILPTPLLARYAFALFLPGIAAILANRFTRVHNQADELNENLEEQVQKRTGELNQALEQVSERNSELREARSETDDILRTVGDGLFLLRQHNDAFILGNQYSRELERVMRLENPAGADFMGIMGSVLTDNQQAGLRKYLELMFHGNSKAKTLNKLNPLRMIELEFPAGDSNGAAGSTGTRHLQFFFHRIKREKGITQLLAAVRDVTSEVELSRELEETREENRIAMERIHALLRVDPVDLADFIQELDDELPTIRGLVQKAEEQGEAGLKDLFQRLHALKGNAGLLGLDFLSEQAHRAENRLVELQASRGAAAQDTEAIQSAGDELRREIDALADVREDMGNWVERLNAFQENMHTGAGVETFLETLENLIARLAGEKGLKVEFDAGEFPRDKMSGERRRLLRDVLVQMVRNSLSHGLENSPERLAAGKPEQGTIKLSGQRDGENFTFTYRDDGRGLMLEKLREKALAMGTHSPEEVDQFSRSQLARLIFKSGVSTAGEAGMHAGRGMGMDVIKARVEEAGGNLALAFQEGQYCEFRITLPANS